MNDSGKRLKTGQDINIFLSQITDLREGTLSLLKQMRRWKNDTRMVYMVFWERFSITTGNSDYPFFAWALDCGGCNIFDMGYEENIIPWKG